MPEDDLEEAGLEVGKTGRRAITAEVDVRDKAAVVSALKSAVDELGRLDVVVANAGICPLGADKAIGAFADAFDVDFIGVVNASNAPIFFPARVLTDSRVVAAIRAVAQDSVIIDTSCTPTTASFINFAILGAIRAGTAPDTIACHALANHANLLGELYVLDQAELQAVGQIVDSYNAYIQAKADSLGWAYVDPNEALDALRTAGQIPTFPNLADPTKPFGDYVSLDGIHPANAAHRLLANLVIDSVNAKFSTSIPELP